MNQAMRGNNEGFQQLAEQVSMTITRSLQSLKSYIGRDPPQSLIQSLQSFSEYEIFLLL